jgi:6-phosphogluconolactonase
MPLTRRRFNALVLAAPFGATVACRAQAGGRLVLVGTYTGEQSRGVYACRFDEATGRLTVLGLAGETRNPSFLVSDQAGRYVYAVNEVSDAGPNKSGGVTSFALTRTPPSLAQKATQPTGGADPCHLALDATGRTLAVANYTGGNFSLFPVGADGAIGAASATFAATGSGPDTARQAGPHGHQVVFDPTNRYLLAVDLGVDRVLVYQFDAAKGTITPNDPPSAALPPGSGPRHLAFHPDGAHLYVINELASTIAAFDWDGTSGRLMPRSVIATLPDGYKGESSTAEIAVHPGGRFLYGSNRGHDSIAVFAIADDRSLRLVHHEPTRGRTPRHFTIDPSGRWLLAANQNSNTVSVFRIDDTTGSLTPTGALTPVSAPVCLLFVP